MLFLKKKVPTEEFIDEFVELMIKNMVHGDPTGTDRFQDLDPGASGLLRLAVPAFKLHVLWVLLTEDPPNLCVMGARTTRLFSALDRACTKYKVDKEDQMMIINLVYDLQKRYESEVKAIRYPNPRTICSLNFTKCLFPEDELDLQVRVLNLARTAFDQVFHLFEGIKLV